MVFKKGKVIFLKTPIEGMNKTKNQSMKISRKGPVFLDRKKTIKDFTMYSSRVTSRKIIKTIDKLYK